MFVFLNIPLVFSVRCFQHVPDSLPCCCFHRKETYFDKQIAPLEVLDNHHARVATCQAFVRLDAGG